jgi:hypothetical protein
MPPDKALYFGAIASLLVGRVAGRFRLAGLALTKSINVLANNPVSHRWPGRFAVYVKNKWIQSGARHVVNDYVRLGLKSLEQIGQPV